MKYKHTQIGQLMIFILIVFIIYSGFILTMEYNITIASIMLFIIFVMSSFSTLRVIVDNDYLQIKFSYGIFSKRFTIKNIDSVKAVKNHWYYGWGIRYLPLQKIWLYNVSGFDAIEIIMKNGKKYRIGTDDVKKLERAILQSIK